MNDDELNAFLSRIGVIVGVAHNDKMAYETYRKTGEVLKNNSLEEMEIIELLESLGYPLEETGTYLYKSLIISVLNYLRGYPVRLEVLGEEELKEQLTSPYSQLYFDIARNDMDLGIKTFHALIIRATMKVDKSNTSEELIDDIFMGNFEPEKYGSNALDIAKYYFALRGFKKGNQKLNRVKKVN